MENRVVTKSEKKKKVSNNAIYAQVLSLSPKSGLTCIEHRTPDIQPNVEKREAKYLQNERC